jgi:hypothetical protein
MMPWQLREGLQRRVKGAPPRPIVENLSAIPVHKLPIPSLNDQKTYIIANISLTFPWICGCKVARDKVEFTRKPLHRSQPGETQTFRLRHFKVGYGVRHSFICNDCGRGAYKLYYHNHRIACRHCHGAVHASQTLHKGNRPVLRATRIQSFLDNKPRLFHRTQERLRKRLGEKLLIAHTRLNTHASGLLD